MCVFVKKNTPIVLSAVVVIPSMSVLYIILIQPFTVVCYHFLYECIRFLGRCTSYPVICLAKELKEQSHLQSSAVIYLFFSEGVIFKMCGQQEQRTVDLPALQQESQKVEMRLFVVFQCGDL